MTASVVALADQVARVRTAGSPNGAPTAPVEGLAEQLGELLGLTDVGLKVTGAAMFGSGSGAMLEIRLSDGEMLVFNPIRDMASPQRLMTEVTSTTGAERTLKQAQCIRAMALARKLATRVKSATDVEIATGWGVEFLQGADVLDVDMTRREDRWGAFKHLERIQPFATAREGGTSLAAACVVLRHVDGTRFVRTGWFRDYVRLEQDHNEVPDSDRNADGTERVVPPRSARGDQGNLARPPPGAPPVDVLGRRRRMGGPMSDLRPVVELSWVVLYAHARSAPPFSRVGATTSDNAITSDVGVAGRKKQTA